MTTPTANRKTVDELIHEIEDRANRNISNRNDIKVLLRHLKAVLDLGRARRDERDTALAKVRELEERLGASNAELWEAQSRIDNLARDLAGLRERLAAALDELTTEQVRRAAATSEGALALSENERLRASYESCEESRRLSAKRVDELYADGDLAEAAQRTAEANARALVDDNRRLTEQCAALRAELADFEQRTMSRRRDPGTSKAGAVDVTIRAGSQRFKLLTAYANAPLATHGLTSDQARERAKISERSCYWKRVSELHAAGLIMTAGEREGDAGSKQTVYAITMKGVQALENVT